MAKCWAGSSRFSLPGGRNVFIKKFLGTMSASESTVPGLCCEKTWKELKSSSPADTASFCFDKIYCNFMSS